MNEQLNVRLDLEFYGERTLIVQTLEELSAEMQGVVERPATPQVGRTGPKQSVLTLISQLAPRLATVFTEAQVRFNASASATGSPQMFCDAYAYLLGEIVEAEQIFARIKIPPNLDETARAFRGILRSIHAQIASWPPTLAADTKRVSGQVYRGALLVACDVTPYYRALSAETGYTSLQEAE